MKILNLISTLGHGNGGHFYDLITVTEELQKNIKILNVNICRNESKVLNSSKIKLINLKFNVFNFLFVLKKLICIIKNNKITHVNCYDLNAFSFANILNIFMKIKIIYTKCGGPNPIGYYPSIDNLIIMSKENYDFFDKKEKFKKTHKVLIPNRVDYLNRDEERILKLKKVIGKSGKVILRISRITNHYETTLFQAVNLYNNLNKNNINVKLIILGVVQNKELLYKLKNAVIKKENAFFITDNYFTHKASEIIPIADFVLGTGRGIMEASYFNKNLLTPLKNEKYPILINKNNFKELFATNFSPRNIVTNYNERENIDTIEKCFTNDKYNDENISFVKSIHENFFDIKNSSSKYYDFYKNCTYTKLKLYDLIRLTTSMIKKFLKSANE